MGIVNSALAQISKVNPLNVDSANYNVTTLAEKVVNVILLIAGIAAVIYLIYSGILYITAAGNPDSAKKGQQGIINAVIGIIVILLAYVIINAITKTTGTSFNA